jgi:hypothetical protein
MAGHTGYPERRATGMFRAFKHSKSMNALTSRQIYCPGSGRMCQSLVVGMRRRKRGGDLHDVIRLTARLYRDTLLYFVFPCPCLQKASGAVHFTFPVLLLPTMAASSWQVRYRTPFLSYLNVQTCSLRSTMCYVRSCSTGRSHNLFSLLLKE